MDDALAATLERALPGNGSVTITRPTSARTSGTTLLAERDDRRWIVRASERAVPPRRDTGREHALLRALARTPVPAPSPVALLDADAMGPGPLLVLEHVEGIIPTSAEALPDAVRARIASSFVEALAAVHATDWRALGLSADGRNDGSIERQLARTTESLEDSIRRSKQAVGGRRRRMLSGLTDVGRWLRARLPAEQPDVLLHGDPNLANVVVDDGGSVVALLDWERWAIGDPWTDVGWLLAFWRDPGDEPLGVFPEHDALFARGPWPSSAALVERYERATSRSAADLRYYRVFGLWKLAVTLEASYVRRLAGTADDPWLARLGEAVPALAARALELAERG